jgi:hypothetical protein
MRDDPDNNLERDIVTCDWMAKKVIDHDSYAQNLYAAMCNNVFQKNDVWPRIADQYWSRSWRSAGGVIANIRQKGDYMDWYCSGMGGLALYDVQEGNEYMAKMKYVSEGTVTDAIRQDLFVIGWTVEPWPDTD